MQSMKWFWALIPAVVMVAPAVASTQELTPSAQSCLEAFMGQLAQRYQPVPHLREARFEDLGDPVLHESTGAGWEMTATDPRTHRAVARATCVLHGAGHDVELLSARAG